MAEGRLHAEWAQTAQISAILLNQWRGKGDRAVQPSQVNPMLRRQRDRDPEADRERFLASVDTLPAAFAKPIRVKVKEA